MQSHLNKIVLQKTKPLHKLFFPDLAIEKDFKRLKRKVMAYQIVFISFGFLFTYLTSILYFQSSNGNLSFIFQHPETKRMVTAICAMFTLVSLWIGCRIRTSPELAKFYARVTYLKIRSSYKIKKSLASNEQKVKCYDNYLIALEKLKNSLAEILDILNELDNIPNLSHSGKRKLQLTYLKNFKLHLESTKTMI